MRRTTTDSIVRPRLVVALAGAAAALAGFASPALAQSYQLTKYLDTADNVQIPGELPGTFFEEIDSETPSYENGVMVFESRWQNSDREGVYAVNDLGVVSKIAADVDLAPGTGQTFNSFDLELISGGMVSFDTGEGIFLTTPDGVGPVTAIVDILDNDPLTGLPFDTFGEYGRDGDLVLFEAEIDGGEENVYVKDMVSGVITPYAEFGAASPLPGGAGATIDGFGEPMTRDGLFTVKVTDTAFNTALLTDFGGGIVTPVNSSVPMPGGAGVVNLIDESSIDGDQVVFQGSTTNTNSAGVYLYNHTTGTFTVIANENTPRPGGGFFDVFNGNPSLSVENGRTVVIWDSSSGGNDGIWAWIDGEHIPVAIAGTPLDGRVIASVDHRVPYGAGGTTTAVRVRFTDGTYALYLAEFVPAPCSGDVDGDGDTDVFDFADLAANFGAGPGATLEMGDLTGDGFVDVFDFGELAADFGCGTGP